MVAQPASGPAGSGDYEVSQGECMSSIAAAHGLTWKAIWNHPANRELKELRKNPNVLLPGDRVFIPEKEIGWYSGQTEKRHEFVRKGVPSKLRLRLMLEGKPRSQEKYTLKVGALEFSGTTDSEGILEQSIPPDATRGILVVGDGQEIFPLSLGHLDPIDELTGVQARLRNLGFGPSEITGEPDSETSEAIIAFQKNYGLDETGTVDDKTRARLQEIHGC
jgi:hypothetical protein